MAYMSSPNPNEIWQVEVGGQVYEAAFRELGDWIGEGSLHPDDKVRKGNLRWIEAKRVPNLVPFFNAKAQGLPMPVMFTTAEPDVATPADVPVISDSAWVVNAVSEPPAVAGGSTPNPRVTTATTGLQPPATTGGPDLH